MHLLSVLVLLGAVLVQVKRTTALELIPPPVIIEEPWKISSLRYESTSSSNLVRATIINPNDYPAGPAPRLGYVTFTESTANCTTLWPADSEYPDRNIYNCTLVEPNAWASWTVELLTPESAVETVDLAFTLTQHVNALGGYWKIFTGMAHFGKGEMDRACNEDGDCVWSLKAENTPALVNATMTMCKGYC
ncbi:hypothetical protein F4677DRAFT_420955 [Hypoxylon crocopeplum]|nr:hypothetical protein F4677DRAFT_420955 [Hypoxylon crocopeplum]